MQSVKGRLRVILVTSMIGVWGALAYACSANDENPGNGPRKTSDSGTDSTLDPTGNQDSSITSATCQKYGGYDNVKVMAGAILEKVKGDCRISAPIVALADDSHLRECFEIQLGGAFQCTGVSYVANVTEDSKKKKCRDMTAAHNKLGLRNADFNAFVEDVATVLGEKGVALDDVRAIAPVFEGTRGGVVQQQNQPAANTFCTCPNGEYMGKSCVPEGGVIDAGTDAPTDAPSDAPADG